MIKPQKAVIDNTKYIAVVTAILSVLMQAVFIMFKKWDYTVLTGNVLSGSVIAVLISAALAGLSNLVFGWLPGFIGDLPLLRIGIPAVLSMYFDIC